jgi:hypothetical protein
MPALPPKTSREQLRDTTYKRARFLLSKHRLSERDVYDFVRDFFREYLSLKYEFTSDELIAELSHFYMDAGLKERVRTFLRSFGQLEYSPSGKTHEALTEHVNDFVDLVKLMIPHHQHQHHGWHRRFARWIRGAPPPALTAESGPVAREEAALLQLEADQDARRDAVEAPPSEIELQLNAVAQHLARGELAEARAAYADLVAVYDALPEADRGLYYEQVHFLYGQVTKAQESHAVRPLPLPKDAGPINFTEDVALPIGEKPSGLADDAPRAAPEETAVAPKPAPDPAPAKEEPAKPSKDSEWTQE